MDKLYWVDGTPVDILRRHAKRMKNDTPAMTLTAAQDIVAKEHGANSWADLLKGSWWPEEPDVDYCGFLQRKLGIDTIGLDFEKIPALWDAYGGKSFILYADLMLDYAGDGRLDYHCTLTDDPNPYAKPKSLGPISPAHASRICEAIMLHAEEGQHGPLIKALNDANLLEVDALTDGNYGEMEALLTLKLRSQGEILGERYLLNCCNGKAPEGEPHEERCFIFDLTGGRKLLTNGSPWLEDLTYRIIPAKDWPEIERELLVLFPDGPEKTFDSEKWLADTFLVGVAVDPAPLTVRL